MTVGWLVTIILAEEAGKCSATVPAVPNDLCVWAQHRSVQSKEGSTESSWATAQGALLVPDLQLWANLSFRHEETDTCFLKLPEPCPGSGWGISISLQSVRPTAQHSDRKAGKKKGGDLIPCPSVMAEGMGATSPGRQALWNRE